MTCYAPDIGVQHTSSSIYLNKPAIKFVILATEYGGNPFVLCMAK
ncbi:hypothetical protein Y024_5192 [Burkholderia pseudomallei TSV44]|nr:hypothetical protein Y024_5192 [Burkholderia pseudomallei TSV44]